MASTTYKSAEGKELVEHYYGNVLQAAKPGLFERRFIAAEGGRTHILQTGDPGKPPLLMLHGSMSNSSCWLGILEDFAKSYRVFCVDIPGEPGLSEAERLPLTCEAASGWLESVLESLGLPRAAFLGMSLGSWYSLCFAVKNPHRVRALSILTTGGIAPQRSGFIFKALLYMLQGQKGQAKLNKLVYHKTEVPPQVLEYQALVSAHFKPVTEPIPLFSDEDLKRLAMPIQYFGGERDALLNTAKTAMRLKALVPQAEIHVLPDTGHVIVDRFAVVKDFLDAN